MITIRAQRKPETKVQRLRGLRGSQFRDSPADSGITGPQNHSLQLYPLSTTPFQHLRK
jgi:hypothetical protein